MTNSYLDRSGPGTAKAVAPRLVTIATKTPPLRIENRLQTGTTSELIVDVASLEQTLCESIKGEVRFTAGDRGLYASDASNYRMVPLGVVLPKDADDVVETVQACRAHGAPILARGGGTAIPGQTVNFGVVVDFSRYMNQIIALDPQQKRARIEPGLVLDVLRKEANKHDLTFGPDPATHSRCTLGGMIGNNSCGVHSVMSGRTSDNVDELEILTYDGTRMRVGATTDDECERLIREGGRRGEIYARLKAFRDKHSGLIRRNFPQLPRRVSGYNLPALLPENGFHIARALVGSECTCVLVLAATTKLVDWPPSRSLLVIGYKDIFAAADHVTEPLNFNPLAVEALDDSFIDDMKKKGMHPKHLKLMPDGGAWLLVEFGGRTKEDANAGARKLMELLEKSGSAVSFKLFDDAAEEKLIWKLREEGLGATAKIPGEPENHEGWEDSAVPPERLGGYLRSLRSLLDKYGYEGALYGHFGDGCVHTRLTFDLKTAQGIENFRSFLKEAADLVVSWGGSLSGEHGDGQARGELLPRLFDEQTIAAFQEFKEIWDPQWKMNPGKLIDPYRVDEHLRLGSSWDPPSVKTYFSYPDDNFSFAEATERCVGAGVCRQLEGGTMCPSYMVTLEEKHSTRGRARLLGEMIRGETIADGWNSEEIKEALDLCLACKGCKGECPVQVDVATYKAEFLSHYFKQHFRPRSAHTMGQIHLWARVAALAPGIANLLSHAPLARSVARFIAGVHPDREMPLFSRETFTQWFHRRERTSEQTESDNKPRVLLWPDTFNNFFHPQTAQAAVAVLEAAGFQIEMPRRNLCCGRPLYDWGMLEQAKAMLERILDVLGEHIQQGTPVVVLEPSCATVFREELINFFPNSETARRLQSQTFLLSEFLRKKAVRFEFPKLPLKTLVHGHCHHKAIMKMDDELWVLEQMEVDVTTPESGCCGMAGAFGFEKEHYDVSLRCGERVLLPAVRSATPDTLIVSDGFSCREQIEQTTERKAVHLAEVIQLGLRRQDLSTNGEYAEQKFFANGNAATLSKAEAALLFGAGTLMAGAMAWGFKKVVNSMRSNT